MISQAAWRCSWMGIARPCALIRREIARASGEEIFRTVSARMRTATLPTVAVPKFFHVRMPALPQTTSHGLLYDHEKDDYENKEHILHRTSRAAILRRGSESEPRQMVRNEKRGGGTDYQRRKCAGDAARQPGTGNMPSHVNLQCLETNGTMRRWFQRAKLTGFGRDDAGSWQRTCRSRSSLNRSLQARP